MFVGQRGESFRRRDPNFRRRADILVQRVSFVRAHAWFFFRCACSVFPCASFFHPCAMLVGRRDLSVHASEYHRRACPDVCGGDVSQGAQRYSDEPKPASPLRAGPAHDPGLAAPLEDGWRYGLVPRYRARRKRRLPDTTRELIRDRMLRLYPRQNQYASLHFLEELRRQHVTGRFEIARLQRF